MQRREFITLLGGTAVAWPLAARAQESERMRRIGALVPGSADDAEYKARMTAFLQELQQLGWSDGRNVRIDTRWAAGDANLVRKYAAELVALAPDVILAPGSTSLGPLLQATRTVPIVFTTILDPVGAGVVDSLARPGGNATGFIAFEYGLSGKWLELLKEIVKPDATGDPSGSSHSRRDRAVCRNPVRGSVVRGGVAAICARLVKSSALSRRSRAFRMAV